MKLIIKTVSNWLAAGCLVFAACQNAEDGNLMQSSQIGNIKRFYSCFVRKTSTWLKNECYNLDKETFSLLLQNKVPAIRLKNFLSQEQSYNLSQNIKNTSFNLYENVYPPIGKIGITQFEHSKKEKRDYFQEVCNASSVRDKIFYDSGVNVLTTLENVLLELGFDPNLALEPGEGRYFYGLIRNMGGAADLHFDYAPYDAPNWFVGKITNQIAWNVYVKLPEEGGETIVYDKIWEPNIYEKFLAGSNTGSYGFKKEVIEDVDYLKIKPSVGDLLFFNSRNFHEVLSSTGKDRFSISCFIGQINDQKSLLLWS